MKYTLSIIIITATLLASCTAPKTEKLPYLGKKELVDGVEQNYKIPQFSLMTQDSTMIDNKSMSPNIYVADFFFISCPSICPKVKKQMLRIYDRFEDEPRFKLISHTLDPKRDTIQRLKQYAENLEVDHDKWYFARTDQDTVMDLAFSYFVNAFVDNEAPGGFDHSGKIILIDQEGHVRGFCEGTEPDSVTPFMDDIEALLDEIKTKK